MVQFKDDQTATDVVDFMKALEKSFCSLLKLHVRASGHVDDAHETNRREVHLAVSELLRDSGEDLLTGREREVTQLVLRGHSAKSIANLLGITPGTVNIHRGKIYQKFGISGQGDLLFLFFSKLSQL